MTDQGDVADVFRAEWPRLVAVLTRETGDAAWAEDLAAEAFEVAARRWVTDGLPDRPGAWLLTTARRRAIDGHRRNRRLAESLPELVHAAGVVAVDGAAGLVARNGAATHGVVDDQLALLCGCCHPGLDRQTQIALTLRIVGGLTTDQIARALLISPAAVGRRLSRARKKLQGDDIDFAEIDRHVLGDRLDVVAGVIYSIFSEGHTATVPAALARGDLCDEALWLAELLHRLVADDPEVIGLRALLLLTDARRPARLDATGRLVTLERQDRTLWDRHKIERGRALLSEAHGYGRLGPYQLLAVIAALHVAPDRPEETEWSTIVTLYDMLVERWPVPVYRLNRAVAVARVEGGGAGLRLIDDDAELLADLADHPYLHATRGELLMEVGRWSEAVTAFGRAMDRTRNDVERRHLAERSDDATALIGHEPHVVADDQPVSPEE